MRLVKLAQSDSGSKPLEQLKDLGKNPDSTISRLILENFDWRPVCYD